MSPSASVPATDMTRTPDAPTADPPATAAPAGRAAEPARRAWAAATEKAPTAALVTIIVLLAGAVGGLLLRELDGIKSDIGGLEADMDARFGELEADMDARFDELEEGQQEIALTLTALVAYLRAGEGVDAALSGHVPSTETATAPDTEPAADDPDNPPR